MTTKLKRKEDGTFIGTIRTGKKVKVFLSKEVCSIIKGMKRAVINSEFRKANPPMPLNFNSRHNQPIIYRTSI